MEHASNEIRASLPVPQKSPLPSMNLTKFLPPIVTTETNPAEEHIETTNLHNVHDIYSRLGYGHLSDAVTQMMICAIVVGLLLLIVIGYLFTRRIPYIIRHTPSNYLARTLMLCGIYTITASAAFVSLIAYRAMVFCDSVCHFAFLLCAYQYFTLIVSYVGGESNFIKNSEGSTVFNVQTPPCCCCLRFLLPTAITKNKFKTLRMMILQMCVVQGPLLSLLNVFNIIDPVLYEQTEQFISIVIVTSILIGVWSLQISSRMVAKHLPEHKIMHKYFAIQLVLILYKLQPTIIHGVIHAIESLGDYRIGSKIIVNAATQLIILLETVLLSYFANRAYSVPTKADQPN